VTDSSAPEIKESAGAATADSLAAESDTFASNRGGEALGVSGKNSTLANEDTTNAETLLPTSSGPDRADNQTVDSLEKDSSRVQGGRQTSDTTGTSTHTGNAAGNIDQAPSYISSQYADGGLPKGKNLTEVTGKFEGEDENKQNASFGTDIGGPNDPGRLPVEEFANRAADGTNGGLAGVSTQKGGSSGTQFDTLEGETDS
jgi:hypothetical protein